MEVCTSPDGKTWQAADLGPGGDEPHGGQHPAVALSPDGHVVAVWGRAVGCPAACDYIVQAAVRPPGGGWGAPVTLTTDLYFGGGIVLGMDGADNAITAWVGNYANASHYAALPAGGSWGPVQTPSNGNVQGAAHGLGLAVSPDGSVVVAFALDDAGQASLVWSQTTRTEAAPRSPGGIWSAPAVLASQPSSSVATAIDGAGNAIAVFGSSYSWPVSSTTLLRREPPGGIGRFRWYGRCWS